MKKKPERRVLIVDEHTHELMKALRKSEGISLQVQAKKAIELYAALMAKGQQQERGRLMHVDAADARGRG